MSSKKDKNKLDEFHYHELLDRAHCLCEIIEHTLLKHPVSKKHKDISKLIIEAQVKLFEAYQEIGNISSKIFHPEEN